MPDETYALITAARNEDRYIEATLKTVVAQTRKPAIWLVVSDGSTDRTDEIVQKYADRNAFISLLHLSNSSSRAFSNQAVASNRGYEAIKSLEFDFVGFLDADISFAPEYYERLLSRFHANPRLGVGGGQIVELGRCGFQPRAANAQREVAGAVQFFRRECYDAMGGLTPLRWGGQDTVANAMARRIGWEVQSFADLDAMHHRPTGTVGTTMTRACFREGKQDYFIGYHPVYEFGKCIRRIGARPWVIGSFMRLCGYAWPGITRKTWTVPGDFVRYLRQEQRRRMLPPFARVERDVCR
jgi:glycosyltransferase involved in cell wall biosynthesis